MVSPILVTKLYFPAPRPKLVPRPGLIVYLDQGLNCKLTLISAPAGFGKTTLVTEWLQQHIGDDKSSLSYVAWLSLDEGDNDLIRFLTYLTEALNRLQGLDSQVGIGAQNMLQSPQPPPAATILITLINEIAAIPSKIALVLDDYHLIEVQPVHEAINFLIENQPPNFHLVIATREDPPLSLSRLRVRDQMTELRAADLRFTSSEAVDFLNQVMGLNLSSEDIAKLETRTEGWIAGLQLAAISMRGRQDNTSFIKSFSGGNRLVLDFLIEEVLGQQSKPVKDFLLKTSILNRLTGPLCDAVTGQDDGQETLETLDRANLFIVPLDSERRWYRYHHLFADLLLQRLRQTQADQLPILQRRASKWCEQNEFIDEAIEYALRADEFERVAQLIDKYVVAIWPHTDHTRFRRWLERLPDEVINSHPHLCILLALHLHQIGYINDAEQRLQIAENLLEDSNSTRSASLQESDLMILRGRTAVIRAILASYREDLQGCIVYATQALEFLPKIDNIWRSLAYDNLGNAYSFMGEVASAYQARIKGLEASKIAGNIYLVLLLSLKLVVTLREQGRLRQVLGICQQRQLELADEYELSQTAIVGWFYTLWGEVLAEINELDEAIKLSKMGIDLTAREKNMHYLGSSYLCHIRVLFSRGDFFDAEEMIRKLETTAIKHGISPWIMNQIRAWQARLWLAQNELDAATQWAEELDVDINSELSNVHDFDYVILARVFITQNRLAESSKLLQRLFIAAEAGGRISKMIEIMILQALTAKAENDLDQALRILEKAITLAEPKDFFRIFVDEGSPMANLLYEALQRGIYPQYVRRLLAAFPVTETEQTPERIQVDDSEWIEPLSEREIDVLQLLAKGLTNQAVADRLVLSIHTVKAHTRSIYGKLAVNNRTQAVDRARTLGVLPPI